MVLQPEKMFSLSACKAMRMALSQGIQAANLESSADSSKKHLDLLLKTEFQLNTGVINILVQ